MKGKAHTILSHTKVRYHDVGIYLFIYLFPVAHSVIRVSISSLFLVTKVLVKESSGVSRGCSKVWQPTYAGHAQYK